MLTQCDPALYKQMCKHYREVTQLPHNNTYYIHNTVAKLDVGTNLCFNTVRIITVVSTTRLCLDRRMENINVFIPTKTVLGYSLSKGDKEQTDRV